MPAKFDLIRVRFGVSQSVVQMPRKCAFRYLTVAFRARVCDRVVCPLRSA